MTDHTEAARELVARIRYQVFRPEVTTTGPCPKCGEGSRGSMTCADCLGLELDRLLPPLANWFGATVGRRYVWACQQQRDAERDVLRRAGDGGG